MTIAYLINQYPQASQSFIRREIAGLEARGVRVERFTVRRWETKLVDAGDQAERDRTRCVLEAGKLHLLLAPLKMFFRRPGRFLSALKASLRLGRRSDRGILYNLIYLAEACVLLPWLEACGAEHVHAHFGTNSTSVALLCRLLGGPPYSFTAHGPEEFDRPQALKLREKIAAASFVVAVSEFGRSQLYRWCDHEHWKKIHVVHCGVDASFLSAAEPREDFKSEIPNLKSEISDLKSEIPDLKSEISDLKSEIPNLKSEIPNLKSEIPNLKSEIPDLKSEIPDLKSEIPNLKSEIPTSPIPNRLVCVGRLAEQKGQLLLVEAAGLLAAPGIDFELVLVGDGAMRPEIESLIAKLRLENRVRIAGWMSNEDVRKEILSSRALILPSFAEGLPVVIMEALALGRPVISTFVAGIPELVENGVCGMLVPAGAVDALADAMARMLRLDAAAFHTMGSIGAARVAERHNASTEAGRLADLFGASRAIPHAAGAVGSAHEPNRLSPICPKQALHPESP